MIPNAKINIFERLFNDCIFGRRYLDQASDEALGATYVGNAAIAAGWTGKQAKVLTLDGTGDYVSYGNLQNLDIGTEDFSVEFVINTTDTAGVICGKRNGAGNGWIVETAAGPDINFQVDDGTEASGNNTTALSAGWHHVLIAVDRSGNATFYIDGVVDGTLDISGSAGTLTNTTAFQVGIDGDDSSNPLEGNVAFIRVWKKLITADEASQLAATEGFGSGIPLFGYEKRGLQGMWFCADKAGTNIPDTLGLNDLTLSNSAISVVPGPNQYFSALDFDATYNAQAANNTIHDITTQDIGISAWIRVDSDVTVQGNIINKNDGDGAEPYWGMQLNTDGTIRSFFDDNTNTYNMTGTADIRDSKWHHIAIIFDRDNAANCKVYLDGYEDGTTNKTGSLPANSFSNTDILTLGSRSDGDKKFDGQIRDVILAYATDIMPIFNDLKIELLYKRQLRGLKV